MISCRRDSNETLCVGFVVGERTCGYVGERGAVKGENEDSSNPSAPGTRGSPTVGRGHLRTQTGSDAILQESFSRFTCLIPERQDY